MGMRHEAGAGADDVVVVDDQETVSRVVRVVMRSEAEAVAGIEPIRPGGKAVIGSPDVDPVI